MSNLRLPTEAYRALCKSILQRDCWKCRSCGSRNALHEHHIVFRSQQGPDEAWNLITLCSSCHDGIHKDVKDGEYGLTVVLQAPEGANTVVKFIRRAGWRPL
jgi:5-methylcytosine-specific restriction endonuclease McrA